jgi:excisionase family DNA binding protein
MTIKPCRNCGDPHQRPQPYCNKCEFMTPREAAERLRVSMPTYYRIVKASKIHPRVLGPHKHRILRAEVDAMLGIIGLHGKK